MNIERDENGDFYYRLPFSFENLKHPYADYHAWPTFGAIAIDMTDSDLYKKNLAERYKKDITFTSLIVRAAALALEDNPILAGVWEGKDKIRCTNPDEISIVGPVEVGELGSFFLIENANKKTVLEIADELREEVSEIRSKGRVGYPWPKDDKGRFRPLFEITNPGMMGVEFGFTVPRTIVTSLMIVCAIKERPVARSGSVVIRKMMNCVLAIDHYAMLAKIPTNFMNEFKNNLEDPFNRL
jgi:pyruvate/2-oxoglutarate dehydrogenase complex dihydrolipoamide acyltransferase (E2) component